MFVFGYILQDSDTETGSVSTQSNPAYVKHAEPHDEQIRTSCVNYDVVQPITVQVQIEP